MRGAPCHSNTRIDGNATWADPATFLLTGSPRFSRVRHRRGRPESTSCRVSSAAEARRRSAWDCCLRNRRGNNGMAPLEAELPASTMLPLHRRKAVNSAAHVNGIGSRKIADFGLFHHPGNFAPRSPLCVEWWQDGSVLPRTQALPVVNIRHTETRAHSCPPRFCPLGQPWRRWRRSSIYYEVPDVQVSSLRHSFSGHSDTVSISAGIYGASFSIQSQELPKADAESFCITMNTHLASRDPRPRFVGPTASYSTWAYLWPPHHGSMVMFPIIGACAQHLLPPSPAMYAS